MGAPQGITFKSDAVLEPTDATPITVRNDGRVWIVGTFYNSSGSAISQGDWVELDETKTTYPGAEIAQGTAADDRIVGVALEAIANATWGRVLRDGIVEQAEDGFYVKVTASEGVGVLVPTSSGGALLSVGTGAAIGYNLVAADSNGSALCAVRCLNPLYYAGSGTLVADTISEKSSGVGVTIDGLLIRDASVRPGLITDPGDVGAIPVTSSGACAMTSAAGETRTVAIPKFPGQWLALSFNVDVGDIVVTFASAINQTGNNTATYADAGDYQYLIGVQVGGVMVWREVQNDGAALSTV